MMLAKLTTVTSLAALGTGLMLGTTGSSQAAEQTAIFAGGCFWCIEKDFEHVPGVVEVVSGYTGGSMKNPTYRNHKGHREAVRITYEDSKVNYDQLLSIFFRTVDPTDDGGQFCDRGFNYSTAVYALDGEQLDAAQVAKRRASEDLVMPIATEIKMASFWTDAEGYHQDYYKKNPVRYKYYRYRCGRDQRVKKLWGAQAYKGVNYGS